jgi:hypothetical protein
MGLFRPQGVRKDKIVQFARKGALFHAPPTEVKPALHEFCKWLTGASCKTQAYGTETNLKKIV